MRKSDPTPTVTLNHYGFILLSLSLLCCQINCLQNYAGDRIGESDTYKITWMGAPSAQDEELANKDDDNIVHISTKDQEKYICLVPERENISFDSSATNSSNESDDGADKKKPLTPVQLLKPLLKGDICTYKFEVFWIYELCHGKYLRQYHEESSKYKSKVTQEYMLGTMDVDQLDAYDDEYRSQNEQRERSGEARPTILIEGRQKPYVMFNMSRGSECDLTKKRRVSRIIYACNEDPSLELYSIKEISTCEYEAIVLVPMLCQHEHFKLDVSRQHEIKCYALDGSPLRPKKTLDYEDNTGQGSSSSGKREPRQTSKAYLQGRTLIIDVDSFLS